MLWSVQCKKNFFTLKFNFKINFTASSSHILYYHQIEGSWNNRTNFSSHSVQFQIESAFKQFRSLLFIYSRRKFGDPSKRETESERERRNRRDRGNAIISEPRGGGTILVPLSRHPRQRWNSAVSRSLLVTRAQSSIDSRKSTVKLRFSRRQIKERISSGRRSSGDFIRGEKLSLLKNCSPFVPPLVFDSFLKLIAILLGLLSNFIGFTEFFLLFFLSTFVPFLLSLSLSLSLFGFA